MPVRIDNSRMMKAPGSDTALIREGKSRRGLRKSKLYAHMGGTISSKFDGPRNEARRRARTELTADRLASLNRAWNRDDLSLVTSHPQFQAYCSEREITRTRKEARRQVRRFGLKRLVSDPSPRLVATPA
jgi:hypothetical protein